jgi:hypothetical protein
MSKTTFLPALSAELTRQGVPCILTDLEKFVDDAWPQIEESPDITRWDGEYAQRVLWEILSEGLERCLAVVYDALGVAGRRRGTCAAPFSRRLPANPPPKLPHEAAVAGLSPRFPSASRGEQESEGVGGCGGPPGTGYLRSSGEGSGESARGLCAELHMVATLPVRSANPHSELTADLLVEESRRARARAAALARRAQDTCRATGKVLEKARQVYASCAVGLRWPHER